MAATDEKEPQNPVAGDLDNVTKSGTDPRQKLKSWLGETLRVSITDGRIIVGSFVCTDRDANVILSNSWEYLSQSKVEGDNSPRMIGLALVPGQHLVSVHKME